MGAIDGCQWREESSPALRSRQSFGGLGGVAGASRCGASQVETIPSGSVVGQDGANSLEVSAHMFYHMYRQEDPSTVEVKDRDEPLELEDQRIVLLNEDKTRTVEGCFPPVGSPGKGHSHP